ncbi:MAG: hypothetical protein NC395_07115 [Prevotella sp.]|nr:hypothetical protein [Prevotella sp.]
MASKYSYIAYIEGDTSGIVKAMKDVEERSKDLSRRMKVINEGLKFNPESVELLGSKFDTLSEQLENAKVKFEALKSVEEQAKHSRETGAVTKDQYAKYIQELTKAENNYKMLEIAAGTAKTQLDNVKEALKQTAFATEGLGGKLSEIDKISKSFDSELKEIDSSLKNNGGVEILEQKYDILSQAIENTKNRLKELNSAQKNMSSGLENGTVSANEQREYQREVENTQNKLVRYENELEQVRQKLDDTATATNEAENETKEFDNAVEDAGQQTVTFGDLLKSNLLSDVIGKAIGTLKDGITDFVKQGVELASSLTEVQNVVDTTFGDGAAEIYAWSDAAAESFGMSSLAAQQYNGTMGAMLKSMGITDEAVRTMSMDMVGLAGDMASFYTLDVDLAFEKIRSGISGETEPLKQLGINMSVANLEAYALSQGIETAYSKMTEAEKATLRYNYLMAQTADAQGDFAKTSDSFANQQRILQLQTENLSASLGEKFLPHLNDVIITINDKMPQAQAVAEKLVTPFADGFGWLVDNGDAVIAVLGALAAGTGAYALAAGGAAAATNLWTAAATKIAAIKAAINPLALVAAAAAAGAVAFKNYVDNMDISAPEQEFVRNVREETEALQQQRQAFEDLRKSQTENDEAAVASANNIKRLWEELQTYVDENGNVISSNERASEIIGLLNDNYNMNIGFMDGQIQKYSELGSSMDDYIENLRLEARIRNGQEAYDEAIRNIDGLMKKRDELKQQEEVQYKTYEKLKAQGFDNAEDVAERRNAISNEIAETDALISEYEAAAQEYENLFEKKKSSGSSGQPWAPDDSGDEESDPDQALKDFVAGLDKKQNLRRLSEEQYYSDLYEHLTKHEDKESEEWFKQLGRYEDYRQKQADAAVKAAEEEKSAQEKLEKEAEEERINTIKGYWDKVTKMKERGEIDDEKEYKLKAQIVKDYCDENEDTWDSYYNWLYDYTKKQEEEIAGARLQAWDESSKELADKLQKSYDELKSQKEQVRSELLGIDLSETVVDKNGNEIEVLNDLDAEIKKIDKYTASLKKLEDTGISDSLLDKINEMSYEDGSRQRMIDTLLSLPESSRQKYYSDWERLYAKEAEAEQKLFGDKEAELNQEAAAAVKDIFGSMPEEAYDEGVKTAQSYLQGIIDSMDGVTDISAVNAVLHSGYADTSVTANQQKATVAASAAGNFISVKTPITFIIDGVKKEKTIEEIMGEASRSGGNPLHF